MQSKFPIGGQETASESERTRLIERIARKRKQIKDEEVERERLLNFLLDEKKRVKKVDSKGRLCSKASPQSILNNGAFFFPCQKCQKKNEKKGEKKHQKFLGPRNIYEDFK